MSTDNCRIDGTKGERPEYVRCIKHTHKDRKKKSWCGKSLYSFDWVFQDLDHAAYSQIEESRQLPCPECLRVAIQTLQGMGHK